MLVIDQVGFYRSVQGKNELAASVHLGDTIGFVVSYHASSDRAARVSATLRFAKGGQVTPAQAMKTSIDPSGQRYCYLWLNFGVSSTRWMVGTVEARFELTAGTLHAQRSLTFAVAPAARS